MTRHTRQDEPVSESEFEAMPDRIERRFDGVRTLLGVERADASDD